MKKILEESLPIYMKDFRIRLQNREDLEHYYCWPDYPDQYSMFNSSIKSKSLEERNEIWLRHSTTNEFISLVVDYKDIQMIGKYTLIFDQAHENKVGNMGVRIHPNYCSKGFGSKLLKVITEWCFINGYESLSMDVLASNERAISCYKNAGYHVTREYIKFDDNFLDMIIFRKAKECE